MAAVVAVQSSSSGGSSAPFQSSHGSDGLLRHHSQSGSTSTLPAPTAAVSRAPRDGSSCDACLRRKSRCAMNDVVNKCYSCEFHRQDCTFTLSNRPTTDDLQSKKRKLEETLPEDAESAKRQPPATPASQTEAASLANSNDVTSRFWCQPIQHIGMTTELEPTLLEHLPLDQNDEGIVSTTRVRKFGDDGTFVRVVNTVPVGDSEAVSLGAIESLVAPHGASLIDHYFERVHPVFPILMEDSFRETYRSRKGLSPLLLSAVYVLTLKFVDPGSSSQTARRPDVGRLESTALKLLTDSLPHPSMSTIQAGLLLMEKSTLATGALNAQLCTAGFELGLHQDCTNWRLETWEKGLRKRMAWALYMQDKWSALVNGRPSHIFAFNWTVKDLVEQDFTDAFHSESEDDDSPVGHGTLLFSHMVALTTILSDILDRFYTLQAMEEFKAAGSNRTRIILDRAKPAQIRLKEWFSLLPPQLRMDSSGDLFETTTEETASNGALHLAYFATEITLHRCIVRSLTSETADAYLSHICRSAAKTRLISAMEFVNRLRPVHLRAFWPAAARTNFSLIGSFGSLLRVTAPAREEAEFYRIRLCEYRWTLTVSRKNAEFMDFALQSLDNSTNLDQHVPDKPAIDELMTSAAKPTIVHQPRVPTTAPPGDEVLEIEPLDETICERSSSIISGLASPAMSVDSDGLQDIPESAD